MVGDLCDGRAGWPTELGEHGSGTSPISIASTTTRQHGGRISFSSSRSPPATGRAFIPRRTNGRISQYLVIPDDA